MDVAGTILRMYRVAKDLGRGIILEKVVTWELIMEKKGRALVVPQIDPESLARCPPDAPLYTLASGREDCIEISCASTPISKEEALDILSRSKATIRDLQEVHQAVKARCPDTYQTAGMIVDSDLQDITHALSTGGTPFPGLAEVLDCLKSLQVDIFVASGDSMRSLTSLKDFGFDLDRIYPVSTPKRKAEIVASMKSRYRRVIMVGDGLNDLYALRAADLGILTVQQDTRPASQLIQAADEIIRDIRDLPRIIAAPSHPLK